MSKEHPINLLLFFSLNPLTPKTIINKMYIILFGLKSVSCNSRSTRHICNAYFVCGRFQWLINISCKLEELNQFGKSKVEISYFHR